MDTMTNIYSYYDLSFKTRMTEVFLTEDHYVQFSLEDI